MENEKYNILLVDDDVDLCALLGEFLEGDGFTVDTLHSGDKAVDTLLNTNN
ncbi:MAG TPA: DNA-binding response regulator, partial [Alteromonas australica]|nr:DNA-binding response regulator [Alteromonas australica]